MNDSDAIMTARHSRIIFLLETLELGGAERQALNFARYLRKRTDISVEIWGLGPPGRVSELCDIYEIRWRSVNYTYPQNMVQQTAELIRVANELRKSKPDVLLPYTWLPNVLCGIGWRFTGAKTCIWNQRDEGLNLRPGSIKHRLAIQLTPHFISNSQHGSDFLIRKFNVKKDCIATISNAVELDPPIDNRLHWRLKLKAGTSDFIACMVANIHPYKDHLTAVKAWKIVSESLARRGRRALLVFAGRNDGLENDLVNIIDQLGLASNILILGLVDDISGLLCACDIAIHSSKHEGCPNAVLEAMAAALPVVGTDLPGMREVLGIDAFRWLVPHGDPENMAKRILELECDSNLLHSEGENNRIRIDSAFNPTKCFEEMIVAILKSIK